MSKNKEKFYMYQEMKQQAGIVSDMLGRYLIGENIVMPEMEKVAARLSGVKRFYFWGLGSSYFSAMYGNYLAEEWLGISSECEMADEVVCRKTVVEPDSLVVVISQSGESTDTIKAAEKAIGLGALVIGISNKKESSLSGACDAMIVTPAQQEKAIAATKTFTAQLVSLILFVLYMMRNVNRRAKICSEVEKLSKHITRVFEQEEYIESLAEKYAKIENIILLGKKFNYPTALESAQKLKETSYIHAEGMAAEEFLHGPKAILEEKNVVIYFISEATHMEDIRIIKDLAKIKVDIVAVGPRVSCGANTHIEVPNVVEALTPIVNVISMQILAFYLAITKKIDLNLPRNIQKIIKK